jgi:hypothetical protein
MKRGDHLQDPHIEGITHIKMDLSGTGCEDVSWIHMALDTV